MQLYWQQKSPIVEARLWSTLVWSLNLSRHILVQSRVVMRLQLFSVALLRTPQVLVMLFVPCLVPTAASPPSRQLCCFQCIWGFALPWIRCQWLSPHSPPNNRRCSHISSHYVILLEPNNCNGSTSFRFLHVPTYLDCLVQVSDTVKQLIKYVNVRSENANRKWKLLVINWFF